MGGYSEHKCPPRRSSNNYDVASYKRICVEFGVTPTSDFRFTGGKNHGLDNVYIGVMGNGAVKTGTAYPGGIINLAKKGVKHKTETCFISSSPTMYRSMTGLHLTKQPA